MNQLVSLLTNNADTNSGSLMGIILIYGAFFAFMYFILFRPQRKKQKAINEMQNSIKVGDSVLTTGGLYGKVVDSINDVLVIEFGTNKSVRVPVQRSSVASIAEPDLSINKEEVEEEK